MHRIEKIAHTEIPHWWDRKKESIMASINLVIPNSFDMMFSHKPASKAKRKSDLLNKEQPKDD